MQVLSDNVGVDTYTFETDASYACIDGLRPAVLMYTADYGCANTIKDLDNRPVTVGACFGRNGQSVKGFKLGCAMTGI
jgi:hypothetical protein